MLRALTRPEYGWKHHPATRMWRGYEDALAVYGLAMCDAWTGRGFADTVAESILVELGRHPRPDAPRPPWLGDEAFHRSHRSNLLRKDAAWYRQWFPDDPDDLEYVWPVKKAG